MRDFAIRLLAEYYRKLVGLQGEGAGRREWSDPIFERTFQSYKVTRPVEEAEIGFPASLYMYTPLEP